MFIQLLSGISVGLYVDMSTPVFCVCIRISRLSMKNYHTVLIWNLFSRHSQQLRTIHLLYLLNWDLLNMSTYLINVFWFLLNVCWNFFVSHRTTYHDMVTILLMASRPLCLCRPASGVKTLNLYQNCSLPRGWVQEIKRM